jgi:hypothetical protein
MSVAGTWQFTLDTPLGKETPTVEFTPDGNSFQGKVNRDGRISKLEDVSVDGDTISFAAQVGSPMGEIRLAFNGTIDGDRMQGKFQTPIGARDFSAKRQA